MHAIEKKLMTLWYRSDRRDVEKALSRETKCDAIYARSFTARWVRFKIFNDVTFCSI